MITKGVRDLFGVREMFQNRAVVTAAQLSKVSPRAPVQPVRASLSGRRADRRKTERALGPGPRRSTGEPPWGSHWDLLSLHRDLQQPQGLTGHGAPGPRAYPLVLITACHQTCMQRSFLLFCLF